MKDFQCSVSLETDAVHIINSKLTVKYNYEHKLSPSLKHTSLDWIGLYLLKNDQVQDDASMDLKCWVIVPEDNMYAFLNMKTSLPFIACF
jgi:hypothetical protein